jgi:serine/threonine protein kinase
MVVIIVDQLSKGKAGDAGTPGGTRAHVLPRSANSEAMVSGERKYKIGERVGDWEVVGQPASGGNARVYRVQHPNGHAGAMKQLFRRTNEAEGRFHREVASLRLLPEHPHLISILDVAPQGADDLWYVMTWIDGGTLHDGRSRFAGQLEASLDVVQKLATATGVLHARGIVHRDVKPDNVLLAQPDQPVLADLGLCWLQDFSTERLTPEDRATGAWGFRAPEHEHARVEDVNASADVFSLVKVLWWLIHGGPPFASAHFEHERFDLARKYSDVRMHSVRTLMSRAITADPASRTISTGEQLAAELTSIRTQLQSPTRGRISAAVLDHVARRDRQQAAMANHQQMEQELEDDFPNLRRRWVEALDQCLSEAVAAFESQGRSAQIALVDQAGNPRLRSEPNCIGMKVGAAEAFIQFEFATNGNRRVVFRITTHVQVRGQTLTAKFQVPPTLGRQLVGGQSVFVVPGDPKAAPLDPAVFWEDLLKQLLRFA